MSDALAIAMVAGETSGDMLAARLLSGLQPQLPDARLHGIGGARMQQHGFVSDWPMEKLAVRGLFEVLAHYREIKSIQVALRDQLLAERPAREMASTAARSPAVSKTRITSPSKWMALGKA